MSLDSGDRLGTRRHLLLWVALALSWATLASTHDPAWLPAAWLATSASDLVSAGPGN